MTNAELIARDTAHLIHPLHQTQAQQSARVWVAGEGALLRDADGNEVIDGLAGLWNVLAGHGRRELAEAARAQCETLAFASCYNGSSNLPAIALAVLMGVLIGYLGFRFAIGGVYFALLTIAFAEFVRIVIDHATWLGGTEGFFLRVSAADRHGIDLVNLRGAPEMYYYLIMALALGALILCRFLLRSRLGYYWQAIRDDAEAAEALGVNVLRYKMYAVIFSSGMAGVAGVFYAFYQNSLFPEIVFNIERSIEATLGPIVGGVGTLFGPILGTFILTPLGELVTEAIDLLKHWRVIDPKTKLDGLKLLIWGFIVVLIVLFKPKGLWPWLRDRLRLTRSGAEG